MHNLLRLQSFFLITIFLSSAFVNAQEEMDPLANRSELSTSSELILIWSESPSFGTNYQYQKVYDYLAPFDTINFYPTESRLLPKNKHEFLDSMGVFGQQHMEVAVGDFNDDGLDDVVSAWIGPDQRINLFVPAIDRQTLSWTTGTTLISPGPLVGGDGSENGRIYLSSGDFDGDRQDEFTLAYQGEDETIHIEVYDTDGGLVPVLKTQINDEALPRDPEWQTQIGLVAADFNQDGRAELAMAARDSDGGPNGKWSLFVKLYQLADEAGLYNVQEIARETVTTEPDYNVTQININLASGDFDHDTRPELAMAYTYFQGQQSGDDSWLYLMEVSDDLNTIAFDDTTLYTDNRIGPNNNEPMDLAAGDVNGDGRDEIIWYIGSRFTIYESDDHLKLEYRKEQGGFVGGLDLYSYNFLTVADFDRDLKDDIIIVRSTDDGSSGNRRQWFRLRAYGISDDFSTVTLKANLENEEETDAAANGGRGRHFAIAGGDFDGDGIRLGAPRRYFESERRQPLVILNSPPVHFEVLDGVVHDVNACFNGNTCNHTASYQRSTTVSGEMETQISMDWGVDTTISGDVNIYGNGVRRSMTNRYGDGFSRDRSRQETFRISFSANAVTEDLVFGTLIDYVIWEYPIFSDDTLRGYMSIVEPKLPTRTWYSTESWPGLSYIPNHEVGNIWSYSEYQNLTNNDYLLEAVKLDNNVRFGLSPTSSFNWEVDWSAWSSGSVSQSRSISTHTGFSWSAGIDIDFFGSVKSVYGEDMNSTYDETEITTHTSTVREDFKINVDLGTISNTEKRYDVTPYAYWGNHGAIVVDYAARPELAPAGFPETWWQQVYGHDPDPAFLLPFKFHPEKGFPLSDETQRQLTKDIIFYPQKADAGDTVRVLARIHNFSLLDTPQPVKVRFYAGDPDNGGTALIGLNGETEVSTSGLMPTRGSAVVKMDFVLPAGLPLFPKIYALIDPDNEIAGEVHEFNNKAYNVLGQNQLTAIDTGRDQPKILDFELQQNYPNPFNPTTRIPFRLGQASRITLKVFDVLGREVATLANGQFAAGSHLADWQSTSVPSGVYFYRLTVTPLSGGLTLGQSRRMMLVR